MNSEQKNGLPPWVWGVGVVMLLGFLGNIVFTPEITPGQVAVDIVGALVAISLALSASPE